MHSFGNFDLSSGTAALTSLIVLTVSGLLGRVLDRLLPWRMAIEVEKILTAEGEEHLEVILQEMRARASQKSPGPEPSSSPSALPPMSTATELPFEQRNAPWDLAYFSLAKTNWEKQTNNATLSPRGIQMAKLDEIKQAIRREQRYRLSISSWRKLQIALALLTLVLIIWHIGSEMPILLSHLFGS